MVGNIEYADRREHQKVYLDGLRRYKNKGVRILIDGKECPETEWERIFEMGEDGGFYMGDYIGAEQGCLKEIRFDKVYLCDRYAARGIIPSLCSQSRQRARRTLSSGAKGDVGNPQ